MSHGHVSRVTIPSYMVKEGDVIEIKEKSRDLLFVLEALQTPERDVPDYLTLDLNRRQGTYLRTPKLQDVPYPVQMEPNLVIEFYSR